MRSLVLVTVVFALVSSAVSQEVERFNISIGAAAVSSKTSTSANGTLTLKPTNSAEEFGSVRYRLNHWHGLELNIGHIMNSQEYTLASNSFRVSAGITEFSGDYVLTPMRTAHWEPFLFGGAGALRFSPGTTFINGLQASFPVKQQTGMAFLYGAGTDYNFWKFLGVRLQYRGLIYKAPNFGQAGLSTHAKGHLAEPAIGLVIKF